MKKVDPYDNCIESVVQRRCHATLKNNHLIKLNQKGLMYYYQYT